MPNQSIWPRTPHKNSASIGASISAARTFYQDVRLEIEAEYREGEIDKALRDMSMQVANDEERARLLELRAELIRFEMRPHTPTAQDDDGA